MTEKDATIVQFPTDKRGPDHVQVDPPELEDFLAEDFPAPRPMLGPIQNEQVIICAAGPGVGKTNLAIGLAHSLCSGREFIGWIAYDKHSVLLVDGEMSGRQLQDRFSLYDWPDDREGFHIVNAISWAARQGLEQPNLALTEWQDEICRWARGSRVVMLDNVMSLVNVSGTSFSSDEFWRTVQPLNLRLRAQGCTVIWIDHTNADGRPFGTRTKEWGADLVFTLCSLENETKFEDTPGCVFTLAFRKVRGARSKAHRDLECEMAVDERGKAAWTAKPAKPDSAAQALELRDSGMTQREIAKAMGVSPAWVNNLLKKAKAQAEYKARRG